MEVILLENILNLGNIGDKVVDQKKVQGQYIGLIKLSKRGAVIFKEVYKECESKGMIVNKSISK